MAVDKEIAERLEAFLGIDTGPCALPGHDGAAMIWRYTRRGLQYGCDCLGWMPGRICPGCFYAREHCQCSPWWQARRPFYFRPLGDTYHAITTSRTLGFDDRLSSGLRAIWWLLLEHDAGLRPVVLPDLTIAPNASDDERRAAEFFAVKYSLEAAGGYAATGVPFPVRLVADRIRVEKDRAGAAIRALRDHGTIRFVRQYRRTPHFEPGPRSANATVIPTLTEGQR